MDEDISWRSPSFRQSVVNKINEAINSSDLTPRKNTVDMENHVFSKARNKDEYLSFVARLIIHVREMNNKNKNADGSGSGGGPPPGSSSQIQAGQGQIQDPINALQNLASQGTRGGNPQIMNQQQQVNPNLGMSQQQQQQANVMTPNQASMIRPQNPQQMMQNQGNMMPQSNAMNPINQMPIGPIGQNVCSGGNSGPMKPNVPLNQNIGQLNQPQMMGPNSMVNQGGQMPMQPNQPIINQNQNMMMMMGGGNTGGIINIRPPSNQMNNPVGINQNVGNVQNPIVNSGQQQIQINMPQMRKQDMMIPNQGPSFSQVRNVNQNFIRQSPSPMSVPSPISLQSQSQHGIASPAMVPSPQAPISTMPNQPRVMQNIIPPSPNAQMNTPGQPQAVQSPMNPTDDQIYREKYNRLTKYKEPLKKMISRVGSDGINSEKLTKLKKLLEILSNPDTRIPLETLVKCEIVLENQFGALSSDPPTATINNPLYDAIVNCIQNPLGVHVLQRTFKPSLTQWFGPDIRVIPTGRKRRHSEDQNVCSLSNEISHILQREIARLDSKFKINLDQASHTIGSKTITIICGLDDKQLPPVPPIRITIPEDYPCVSPQCNVVDYEYDDTEFLMKVKKALKARVSKLPTGYSITHILETWCLAIRQACNPNYIEASKESVLFAV